MAGIYIPSSFEADMFMIVMDFGHTIPSYARMQYIIIHTHTHTHAQDKIDDNGSDNSSDNQYAKSRTKKTAGRCSNE